MKKDCRDCKHSYNEDLDGMLCCDFFDKILVGVLDEEIDDIPCCYDYKYPNVCDKFKQE